jgi:hypothetical protein
MTDVKVVQYSRVERYAVTVNQDGSPSVVDVEVVYEHGRPARFVLNHKSEIDEVQLRALLEVLRKIGFNLGGEET